MHRIAVFAGLGSESLFSNSTLDRAVQDATLPESQILLRSLHDIFREQIALAVRKGQLPAESLDLDDFQRPETLLRPSSKYHQSVVIQHTTIFLSQICRYLGHQSSTSAGAQLRGAAGFCVGLFPAATTITAHTDIEFLQRAQDFFLVTLWLGIHSETLRLSLLARHGCPQSLPWSIVVDNADQAVVDSINSLDRSDSSVYISAKNSPTCITISGRGDELAKFVAERLPSQCRTRSTNVFTLYHDRRQLQDVFDKTMESLENETSLQLDAPVKLVAPLFSSVEGASSLDGEMTFRHIISLILEMILQEAVDWVSVQKAVFGLLELLEQSGDQNTGRSEILNFGPGYGISRSAVPHTTSVEIRDVSASGAAAAAIGRDCASDDSRGGISPDDIAIVGMAVELPDASDADELWQNLCHGRNSVSEIPASRFHIDDFYQKKDENGNRYKRSIKTRYGNFIKNPFLFDNDLFDISPREAKSMDPQQRVLLQTAYRALEDAGYVPDSTPSNARDTFGCFIGNATLDYTDNLARDIDVYYSPGTLRAFQSGRISYYFGWSGVSLTLDTACSSSMVAMHQAVRAMRAGDCRAALVGGANVITSPDMYLGLDRAHFLSSTGQCKAFDASADGYCRAEGCGVFVLKKVGDALAEGDRIHGIIKGIEANQSGNAHSITHPHAPTQEKLFNRLLDKSGVHPHQISVVETHGTGTQAGDPNELESLRSALCHRRDIRNPVHFTSIKANIGHCEAASGAASLSKVLLMMRHGQIPPQISLQNLNPKIKALGTDGARISPDRIAWQQQQPRLALLHNIGAAGSNVAMVVREYNEPQQDPATRADDGLTYMLGISGKSAKVASKLQDDLIAYLTGKTNAEVPVADLCYTMTARRQLYDHRITVTGNSIPQLVQNLRTTGPMHVASHKGAADRVVFVFSGQGAQYLGMGQQLLSMYPIFSQTVHKIDGLLTTNGFPGCLDIISPSSATTGATDLDDARQVQAFQTAIFAVQVALAQLLASWGVTPSAVIGHSIGEYAALVTAGVLDIASGTLLVARRAQLLVTKCELSATSMLAVNLGASKVRSILEEQDCFSELDISCDNSPGDCVVGGPVSRLEELKQYLTTTYATKSKLLDVPMAYHTRALDPILSDLTKYARTLRLGKPTVPVISTVLGRTVHPGEGDVFTPEYLTQHSRDSVSFRQAMASFSSATQSEDAQTTHWVEVGPHASLLPMIKSQISQSRGNLLPCLRKGVNPSTTISQLMKHFYENAIPVDWRQAFKLHNQPRFISLPGLPFFQTEFVVSCPRESGDRLASMNGEVPHPSTPSDMFLGRLVQKATDTNGLTGIYETPVQSLGDFITGHMVCGHALCPASVYHQMALSAVRDIASSSGGLSEATWSLTDVEYVGPLLYTEQSPALIRTTVSALGRSREVFTFEVSSYAGPAVNSSQSQIHCRGLLKNKSGKSKDHKYSRMTQVMNRQISRLSSNIDPNAVVETFSTKAMYDSIFTRVVTYSKPYQLVQFIRISPDYGEAHARCRVPSGTALARSAANSIFMDVLLHVAGFVANMSIEKTVACICKEVSSALVLREPGAPGAYFDVCCTLTTDDTAGHIIADAQASDENGLMASFKGMVFQQVQLDKISKAFEIASRRISQGTSRSISKKLPSLNTASLSSSLSQSTKVAEQIVPGGKDAPLREISTTSANIRTVIAQTCGADPSALHPEAKLEQLGFDSLLLIELEGQLLTVCPSINSISSLADCVTVRDVEKLCAQHEATDTPSIPAGTKIAPTNESGANEDALDVQSTTRRIIAETCSVDCSTIDSNSELVALGIDSLMFYELESSLAGLCQDGNLSTSQLSECRTVGDVENLVADHVQSHSQPCPHDTPGSSCSTQGDDQSSEASFGVETPPTEVTGALTPVSQILFEQSTLEKVSTMLKLNSQIETIETPEAGSSSAPLFLIHDGSGICAHYHRLRSLNRPVYALHDPKFLDTFDTWSDLSQMAEHYAQVIESIASGPLLVGGWSFGGVVAYEVSRHLSLRGHTIVGTVLIDAPPPLYHQPLSPAIIDAVTTAQGSGYKQPAGSEAAKAIRYFVRRSFTSCANLLGAFHPQNTLPDASTSPAVLLRSREGWHHPSNSTPLTQHHWLQNRDDPHEAVAGWETITGRSIPWVDIPGNHFEVFDAANIEAVSEAVCCAVRELETTLS